MDTAPQESGSSLSGSQSGAPKHAGRTRRCGEMFRVRQRLQEVLAARIFCNERTELLLLKPMLISASRSANAWRSFRIDLFAYVSDVFQPISPAQQPNCRVATTLRTTFLHYQPCAAAPLKKSAVVCAATATFFALTATIALSCDGRGSFIPCALEQTHG